MRNILMSLLLAFLCVGLAMAAEDTGPAAEEVKKEIIKIDQEKLETLRHNGPIAADWFHKYVDEGGITTSFDGHSETKAEHEPKMRSGKVWIITMNQYDHRVRVFQNGTVAVVTYKETGQLKGQPHPIEGVSTEVWIKEDMGWRRILHDSHQLATN